MIFSARQACLGHRVWEGRGATSDHKIEPRMAGRAEEGVMAEVHLADDFYLSKERGDAKKILTELIAIKGGRLRSGEHRAGRKCTVFRVSCFFRAAETKSSCCRFYSETKRPDQTSDFVCRPCWSCAHCPRHDHLTSLAGSMPRPSSCPHAQHVRHVQHANAFGVHGGGARDTRRRERASAVAAPRPHGAQSATQGPAAQRWRGWYGIARPWDRAPLPNAMLHRC